MIETHDLPGFDDPLALLLACHDKIRHFARLSLRLEDHVRRHGADQAAMTTALAILRYFDVAAPLHHADEEEDLFPALRNLGDSEVDAQIASLEIEHADLLTLWLPVRGWMQLIAAGRAHPAPSALPAFARLYPAHADREERRIFAAARRLPPERLQALGHAMAARRGAPA